MKQTGKLMTTAPAFVTAGAKALAPHSGKLNAMAFTPAATAIGGLAMNSMGGAAQPDAQNAGGMPPAPAIPKPPQQPQPLQTTIQRKPMLNF